MRKRLTVGLVVAGVLGSFAAVAPLASASTTKATVPPVCVERTVGKLHVQIGYCPGWGRVQSVSAR